MAIVIRRLLKHNMTTIYGSIWSAKDKNVTHYKVLDIKNDNIIAVRLDFEYSWSGPSKEFIKAFNKIV